MDGEIGMVELVGVCEKKVWLEQDIFGSTHVMVCHEAEDEEPFCYCSFHYDHRHTSNSILRGEALEMAKGLGAPDPVEIKSRSLNAVVQDNFK